MHKFPLAPLAILGLATLLTVAQAGQAAQRKTINVVVWDEQQPIQKQAYENFLGNAVADELRKNAKGTNGQAELVIRSVRLDDPEQGISKEVLDKCDVLIWWGHQRHGEIKPEAGKAIVERIKSGQLSLIALHSAHWSTPFIEAMNERAVQDALKTVPKRQRTSVKVRTFPAEKRLYRKDEPTTPSYGKSVLADGTVQLEVKLPSCVFTAVRDDGKPSHIRTLLPNHPIAQGVSTSFDIPKTEVYDGPFHVPAPDAVVFGERWDDGANFPAGCVWNLGKGKVFYFRPGHETYPIFKQPEVARIVENAVRWLGEK